MIDEDRFAEEEAHWPDGRTSAATRDPRYSQSLERGLAMLESFSPQRELLGIADMSELLGMSRSTTHRYAATLLALGYLEQDAARKYRLGDRALLMAQNALACAEER